MHSLCFWKHCIYFCKTVYSNNFFFIYRYRKATKMFRLIITVQIIICLFTNLYLHIKYHFINLQKVNTLLCKGKKNKCFEREICCVGLIYHTCFFDKATSANKASWTLCKNTFFIKSKQFRVYTTNLLHSSRSTIYLVYFLF